jgi:hypothetical protein
MDNILQKREEFYMYYDYKIKKADDITYNNLSKIVSHFFGKNDLEIFLKQHSSEEVSMKLGEYSKYTKEYWLNEYNRGNIFVLKDSSFTSALILTKDGYELNGSNNLFFDSSLNRLIRNLRPNNPPPAKYKLSTASIEEPFLVYEPRKEVEIKIGLIFFRPKDSFRGEYGFDWLRQGETLSKFEKDYKKTLKNKSDFNSIKQDYKKENIKLKDGTSYEYYIPKMTIYPDTTQTIQIYDSRNNTLFKKVKFISSSSKVEVIKDSNIIVIKAKEFSSDVFITAKYDYEVVGKLQLLANAKRYQMDILLVRLETNLNRKETKIKKGTLEKLPIKERLTKFLGQAYITPNIEILPQTLEIDSSNKSLQKYIGKRNKTKTNVFVNDINDYLRLNFDKAYPEYKNHLKIFFTEELAYLGKMPLYGLADDIGGRHCTIFKKGIKRMSTTAHEALHTLGLEHSFRYKSKYYMKKHSTHNLMDYANKLLVFTWDWQWKIIQNNSLVRKEQ